MRRRSPALAFAALVLASCGGSGDKIVSDAERFCGEAIEHRNFLVAPPMSNQAELDASLDFYRLMGQLAPLAIATEWNTLVTTMETASTLVPGDSASEQLVAMTAYASEPAAFRVKTWLLDNCRLDIPITTIAPQEPAPARTTTTTISAGTPDSDGG